MYNFDNYFLPEVISMNFDQITFSYQVDLYPFFL